MKKRKPAEVASREAYEEAGLIGQIVGKRPLGRFHYEKRVGKESILCQVRVFLFRVERQLDDWPEKSLRETNGSKRAKPQLWWTRAVLQKSSIAFPDLMSGS
jgi:8-oxo-dGTP pyrophosphatase MutT (NUDIX family)